MLVLLTTKIKDFLCLNSFLFEYLLFDWQIISMSCKSFIAFFTEPNSCRSPLCRIFFAKGAYLLFSLLCFHFYKFPPDICSVSCSKFSAYFYFFCSCHCLKTCGFPTLPFLWLDLIMNPAATFNFPFRKDDKLCCMNIYQKAGF